MGFIENAGVVIEVLKILKKNKWWGIIILFVAIMFAVLKIKIVDDVYKAENGHYYMIAKETVTWDSAKNNCRKEGGHLVTLTSSEEKDIVVKLLKEPYYWIGAKKDEEGNWVWITDEEFEYTNWFEGEPNDVYSNENVVMMYNNGEWNDIYGGDNVIESRDNELVEILYICEWEHKFNIIVGKSFSFGLF